MKFRRNNPETPHVDLSAEMPADRAELHIVTEHAGWVSSMGNAVIFVGRARQFAEELHIDVDELVRILRDEGVTEEYMQTLAVLVHERSEVASKLIHPQTVGWHKKSQGVHLESETDGEHVVFSNALHVIGGAPLKDLNHTLLHEAGHLQADATGNESESLYTPTRVRRLRRLGFGALVAAAGLGTLAGYESMQSGDLAHIIAGISGGGALSTGFIGALAAKFPLEIQWIRSPEEQYANRFAARWQKVSKLVTTEPRAENARIVARRQQVSYEQPLTSLIGPLKKPLQSD